MSAAVPATLAPQRAAPPAIGMWIFIASELLFFGGLMAAYGYARLHAGPGFASASRHTHVVLGTLNTAVLLTSSALIAAAVACAQHRDHRRWTARLLYATAALGGVFLAIKGFEYGKEWQEGLFPGAGFTLHEPGAQLFFMLYFTMTGLHAVHMLCGIAAVLLFARGCGKRRAWASPERVESVALYWHFVDMVWIFLYPFLYLVVRHA